MPCSTTRSVTPHIIERATRKSIASFSFARGFEMLARPDFIRLVTCRATLASMTAIALCSASLGAQTTVGVLEVQSDVGHVRRPGSTLYVAPLQQYRVSGSLQNIWSDTIV